LGTEVVDIYVGPERKHYVVHKKPLTSRSEYFSKALDGHFREAEENSIHLKEDDPAAVALLIGVCLIFEYLSSKSDCLRVLTHSNYSTN